jgi:homoserine kinase
MILDKFNEFSDAQAVTATALSTNVIDLGTAKTIENKPFYLVIKCVESATASSSATVTFTFETDDSEAIDSSTTLWSSAAIAKAALTAGTEVIRLPINGMSLQQYLGVRYTVADGPLLTGKFDAFLTFDGDTNEF